MAEDGNTYTVKEIVTRLEAKVDKVLDDHENRLRAVETFRIKWSGVAAFIVAVAAFVFPLAFK